MAIYLLDPHQTMPPSRRTGGWCDLSDFCRSVAAILLADGNTKAARVALEPIAYSAHGSPLTDLAERIERCCASW